MSHRHQGCPNRREKRVVPAEPALLHPVLEALYRGKARLNFESFGDDLSLPPGNKGDVLITVAKPWQPAIIPPISDLDFELTPAH
jgi:hypothetical protein